MRSREGRGGVGPSVGWSLFWLRYDQVLPRWEKRASDGTHVVVAQNSRGAWCVATPGTAAFDPYPMGEFVSAEAAWAFADPRFPGGAWARAERSAGGSATSG